jgi:ribosomal protein S18 acetylase RimI-like enzyme
MSNFEEGSSNISRRFHYVVFETPIKKALELIKEKKSSLIKANAILSIKKLDSKNNKHVQDLIDVYNEVALTAVDPYKEMTEDEVQTHFTNNTYLGYAYGEPAGYCILSYDMKDEKKVGIIAGIGIHHRHRGKKFSTALLANMFVKLKEENVEIVRCDILVKNKASLGLFSSYGFKEVDDFYLS